MLLICILQPVKKKCQNIIFNTRPALSENGVIHSHRSTSPALWVLWQHNLKAVTGIRFTDLHLYEPFGTGVNQALPGTTHCFLKLILQLQNNWKIIDFFGKKIDRAIEKVQQFPKWKHHD